MYHFVRKFESKKYKIKGSIVADENNYLFLLSDDGAFLYNNEFKVKEIKDEEIDYFIYFYSIELTKKLLREGNTSNYKLL